MQSWAAQKSFAPGATPDVVMECFEKNQVSDHCSFACSSILAQSPNGNENNYSNVSRVEFYYKQKIGRTDTRTWVFVEYKTTASAKAANVAALYLGPTHDCLATITQLGSNGTLELRITSFQFD